MYNSLGEYTQAKELYEKVPTIRKKIFGKDHAHVTTTYGNLASVPISLVENSLAKELRKGTDDLREDF